MPELETPPATPPEQPPVAPETKSIANADGTLPENWHTMLSDESLHKSETLPRFKNIESLAKSYEHVRKQVPMDKMARPNENWGESDWDEFHKAGGRPDTKEDYNITYADEIPEALRPPKEVTEKFQEIFHKYGASKKLVDALTDYNNELTLAQIKTTAQADELAGIEVQDAVRKDWGLAYEQNVHRGNVAIDKDKDAARDPAYKARLLEKVNKDPDLIRFASNMGSKFVEANLVQDTGIPSIGDMDTKIREAQGLDISDPKERANHPYWNARHPNHDNQIKIVQQLIKAKSKSKKVG